MPSNTLGGLLRAAERAALRGVAKAYVAVTERYTESWNRAEEAYQQALRERPAEPIRPARRRRTTTLSARPLPPATEPAPAPAAARQRKPRTAAATLTGNGQGAGSRLRGPRDTPSPPTEAPSAFTPAGEPAAARARGGRAERPDSGLKSAEPKPDGAAQVTPQAEFREPILRALMEMDRPVTFGELMGYLADQGLVALKPGDEQVYSTGRTRWQFMASKELGVLRQEGRVAREGDHWHIPPND